jgi:hypothetical protein
MPVTAQSNGCWKSKNLDEKNFSHVGSSFPLRRGASHDAAQQGLRKLQAQQMVTFGVGYSHNSGAQIA